MPVINKIYCQEGAIKFTDDEWQNTLKLLRIKRPDLVDQFKDRSIQLGDNVAVLKKNKCLFFDDIANPCRCVLQHILHISPASCSCIHGLKPKE